MTVYTLDQFVGGLYGLHIVVPTASGQTAVMLAIDCEGANGYTYTTATAPPGVYDIASTTTGTVTLAGTWQLTNTRANLGTTSLKIPSAGTTEYFQQTSGSSVGLKMCSISTWIYLDALPSTAIDPLYISGSAGRPATPTTPVTSFCVEILTDGKLRYTSKYGATQTIVTSAAALTAGAWHYIGVTQYYSKAWIKINGTVEQFNITENTAGGNSVTSAYGTIKGGTAFANGVYLDDVRMDDQFDRRLTIAAVPSVRLETFAGILTQTTIGNTQWSDVDLKLASYYHGANVPWPEDWTESYLAPAGLASEVITRSPALRYLYGTNFSGNTIIPGGTGGGGSIRPTSGFIYPRGDA